MNQPNDTTNQSHRTEDRLQELKNDLLLFQNKLNSAITLLAETIDKLNNTKDLS